MLTLPVLPAPAPRDLCTDCGLSRSTLARRCGAACQFVRPDYAALERRAHGRERDARRPDELHFGAHLRMLRARRRAAPDGAQWSGITTRLAERLLEEGLVDAVIATASDPSDRWAPRPVLVTRAAELAACRGMKMGFSPVLALLDEAAVRGLRRLAVVGVSCQVHALRAVQDELGLEALYVIGTPCSDNTTTARFHEFLARLAERPEEVTYLEFCADYHVELRFADGAVRRIPFARLPLADLPADFFPLTCRACFDYANALADVTVGYMAGEGDQWLIVRNAAGERMLALVAAELDVAPLTSSGRRRGAVRTVIGAAARLARGEPRARMPDWARPLVAWLQPRVGPRGLEFARARVEMKAGEGIVTLRALRPRRVHAAVPAFAWRLAAPYGIAPLPHEAARTAPRPAMSGGT